MESGSHDVDSTVYTDDIVVWEKVGGKVSSKFVGDGIKLFCVGVTVLCSCIGCGIVLTLLLDVFLIESTEYLSSFILPATLLKKSSFKFSSIISVKSQASGEQLEALDEVTLITSSSLFSQPFHLSQKLADV